MGGMEIACRHSTVNPRLIDGDGRTATGGQSDNSTLRPRRHDDDCATPASSSLNTSARPDSRLVPHRHRGQPDSDTVDQRRTDTVVHDHEPHVANAPTGDRVVEVGEQALAAQPIKDSAVGGLAVSEERSVRWRWRFGWTSARAGRIADSDPGQDRGSGEGDD